MGLRIIVVIYLLKIKLIVKKPNSGGGLALLWKEEMILDVINFTDNQIFAKVVKDDGFVWYLTGFYGWQEANKKPKSWALLPHSRSFIEGPWCCIGDFNAILHASEKQSIHAPNYNQMEDFRVALEECELAVWGSLGINLHGQIGGQVHLIQNKGWIELQPIGCGLKILLQVRSLICLAMLLITFLSF